MANHDTYEKDILKALQKIGIQMESVNKNLIKLTEAIQSVNTGFSLGVDLAPETTIEKRCSNYKCQGKDGHDDLCIHCDYSFNKWEAIG